MGFHLKNNFALLKMKLCAKWQQISEMPILGPPFDKIPPPPPFSKGGNGGISGAIGLLVPARPG
jgi:hypothetical protein